MLSSRKTTKKCIPQIRYMEFENSAHSYRPFPLFPVMHLSDKACSQANYGSVLYQFLDQYSVVTNRKTRKYNGWFEQIETPAVRIYLLKQDSTPPQ